MEYTSQTQTQTVEVEISVQSKESNVPIYQTNVAPISYSLSTKKVKKTPLEGVEGAFLLSDVLTLDECKQYIATTEKMGYADAPVTTYTGMKMMPELRDNKRVMWQTDNETWEPIWKRVKDFLPKNCEVFKKNWSSTGLNERFRFYRYEPGEVFNRHYDGCFPRSKTEMSHLTFIVYLSDGFEGGQTTFYLRSGKQVKVDPVSGTALVFWHGSHHLSPEHEGSACKNGNKYVLRSDIMYKMD